jgi:dienelactone hydrolase
MKRLLRLIFPLLLLSGCSPATATPAPALTATPRPAPTATVPAATATPPLTTAQLMYPYTIEGLRQHKFQSGSIHIMKSLGSTDAFLSYLISYPSDGLTITGVMQIPAQGKPPFPVIIMDHGFFNRTDYHSGDGTDRAAEYFNRHGYITLASDYRSWGPAQPGPSLYYSGLAIDVVNLISAVASVPQADPKRIGIWGHSMGGAVTMKVLTIDSRPLAAVLYSTVSADDADVVGRWGLGCIGDIAAGETQLDCNSSDVVPLDLPAELIKAYYEASRDASVLHETSPIYHLQYVTAPVEINYGTNDGKTSAGTPPEWSQKLYKAFEEAGKPAHLYAYQGEYHSFNGDAWMAFMERSARFFDEYVKNAALP